MKRFIFYTVLSLTIFPLLMVKNCASAQPPNGNRYNLAVYATGLQDGDPISTPVKNIAQNTASTNLTGGGNYQLIERSNEFLKQIEEEKHFQQSGDVADNQIAELGASYGAQKICVISITIEGDYLYVAARIVDVATKTSYESGEADILGYTGIAQIRPTVVSAIKRILTATGANTTVDTLSTASIALTNNILPKTSRTPTVSKVGNNIEFSVNGITFKMVFIEGGAFTMGSFTGKAKERPVNNVIISDFYMGETEVPQSLWKAVMGNNNNPSHRQSDFLPVDKVTWMDCNAFILNLNRLFAEQLPEGYCFVLPSEAQWEYAARGGLENSGNLYAGSSNIDNVAWYKKNSGGRSHDVMQKTPNELGLYDMSGNVWEWCEDSYNPKWYSVNSDWHDPINSVVGSFHVLRGGSWDYPADYCRVSNRNCDNYKFSASDYGFRIALVRR